MSNELTTVEVRGLEQGDVLGGYRPNNKTLVANDGRVYFPMNENQPGVPFVPGGGLRVMSYLMEDEWKLIDREVIEAAQYPLRVIEDVRSAGLVVSVDPNVLMSTWYTQGDMTGPTTNMLGRSMADRDIPEIEPASAPIPMTYKDLSFSTRGIGASRRIGQGIDLTMISLTSRKIAERMESLMINGDTSIKFNGATLYGLLTHPSITTDTAVNWGGGDFATLGNFEKVMAGVIQDMNDAEFRGPFTVYLSETQYNQVSMTPATDVPQTPLQRVLTYDSVRAVHSLPTAVLPAGSMIVAQMTRDVMEWAEGQAITVREWNSGNGMEVFFRLMAIGGPRIKARQDGTIGIRVVTGA